MVPYSHHHKLYFHQWVHQIFEHIYRQARSDIEWLSLQEHDFFVFLLFYTVPFDPRRLGNQ